MTQRPSKEDSLLNALLRRALDYEIDEVRLTRAIHAGSATPPQTPRLSLWGVIDRRPAAVGATCVALSFLAGLVLAPADTSSGDAVTVALALGDMSVLIESGFPVSSGQPEGR